MNEKRYKIVYNYERVPKILQKSMAKWYMKHISKVGKIYNELIPAISLEYDLLDEPIILNGNNRWDINPKYWGLVCSKIKPHLRSINNQFAIFQYDIDENGNIIAYIKGMKYSKLYITLIESKK